MREIKFRGKDIESGEWIYGYYYRGEIDSSKCFIISDITYNEYEVNPETVGQFTGLTDKNGKEIYEFDIITNETVIWKKEGSDFIRTDAKQKTVNVVQWDNHWASWHLHHEAERGKLEVIGNIHENPELVGE